MYKFTYNFKALWTHISIVLIAEDENKSDQTVNKLYENIVFFENEFSRFKESSSLSLLNKNKELEVSWEFIWLLLACSEIYKLTKWQFNPLVDIRTYGYTSDYEKQHFEILDVKENLQFEKIKIYWNSVVLENNMHLDFWAIWKWFLADKLRSILLNDWYSDFILNIWWDIVVNWLNQNSEKWSIWIMSPFDGNNLGSIRLSDMSVSTSGSYLRKWKIENKMYSHIKNPLWVENSQLLSVTIVDRFGYRTDGIATGVFNMWTQEWINFCNKNNIDCLMILNDWKLLYTNGFDEKYNLNI